MRALMQKSGSELGALVVERGCQPRRSGCTEHTDACSSKKNNLELALSTDRYFKWLLGPSPHYFGLLVILEKKIFLRCSEDLTRERICRTKRSVCRVPGVVCLWREWNPQAGVDGKAPKTSPLPPSTSQAMA